MRPCAVERSVVLPPPGRIRLLIGISPEHTSSRNYIPDAFLEYVPQRCVVADHGLDIGLNPFILVGLPPINLIAGVDNEMLE